MKRDKRDPRDQKDKKDKRDLRDKKTLKSLFCYCLCSIVILSWWFLAFKDQQITSLSPAPTNLAQLELNTKDLLAGLSSIQRDTLHSALSGNWDIAMQYLVNWDVDASVLANQGISHIQRLSDEEYLEAHLLSRLLTHSTEKERIALNQKYKVHLKNDDFGYPLKDDSVNKRFFPQSFVAASILLALAPETEVTAIPQALKHYPQLVPKNCLNQIPLCDSNSLTQKVMEMSPSLIFTSPYSHPSTLETLREQGFQMYMLQNINNLQDIQNTILKIGHATQHPLEATLMTLFFKACLLSIDNRLEALHQLCRPCTSKKALFLFFNENQHFLLPTAKCLFKQLHERLLAHYPSLDCPLAESEQTWRIPINKERIKQYSPDCLFIAALNQDKLPFFEADFLMQLPAYKKKNIYYLDESVQETPTQYLLLAYYDLYLSLAASHLP